MYVEVTNITDNQLTFKIEGDFEEQQTEIKEISDREKYDGRDDGIVTPVKDQEIPICVGHIQALQQQNHPF